MTGSPEDIEVAMVTLAEHEATVLVEAVRAPDQETFVATIAERLHVTKAQAELIAQHRFTQIDQSNRELIYEALSQMQI